MKEKLWQAFAWLVSRQPIADYLIGRATRTPYFHLDGYMLRFWLWNRHDDGSSIDEAARAESKNRDRDPRRGFWRKIPSVRIHHILRQDLDRAKHDHPFDFRTIILRNGYTELRGALGTPQLEGEAFNRRRGDTAVMRFGDFHNIIAVPPEGAWTMVFCFDYKGTWGFDVEGVKVPWRKHLGYE